MSNLELIDAYFNGELPIEEKKMLEQRITSDALFADETAFYVSSVQVMTKVQNEEKSRFKNLYEQYKLTNESVPKSKVLIRRFWTWTIATAAVLTGIIFGWYFWFRPESPVKFADQYILENFSTFPVNMGAKEDSLQTGLRLYNDGKAGEALIILEALALHHSSLVDAKKYAGIISIKLGQFDKANLYFSQIESTQLYSNPGKFYRALTFMKRNKPGDMDTAKRLLEQVVENDLEGEKEAQEWLEEWNK